MNLLAPLILFSVEIHIPAAGLSRAWTTPRDLSPLTPAQRVLIAQHLEAQVDQLLGLLKVTKRLEVVPTLTAAQAKAVLD